MLRDLWFMVNDCLTLSDVQECEIAIKKADITTDDYDDLMIALSQVSREIYHVL